MTSERVAGYWRQPVSEQGRVADASAGELPVDHLTGALARAVLDARLTEAVGRAQRSGSSCSVCLVDIDQLKSVNDTFGHSRGDLVLRQVVERIARQLRGADAVFRYGGDEFVLVLPYTGKAEAAEVALCVVEAVGREPLAGEPALRLTISLGVASFPEDAADPAGLLAVADARTYLAKRRGRGRVAVDDIVGDTVASTSRLLERDAALATAQRFLAEVAADRPGLLRVSGLRGAGFTRFADEVADLATLRGFDVRRLGGLTPDHPTGPDTTATGRQLLVIADGEAAWAAATGLATTHLRQGGSAVGLMLAGPGRPGTAPAGPLPQRGTVELPPWTPDAIRIWLRTRLQGEPSTTLIDHLHTTSNGLPARAQRILTRLTGTHTLHRLPDGLTLTAPPPAADHRRLPTPPTELVGRGVEIDQLITLLDTERLITLTGPGGIGKTRLALAAAAATAERHTDGATFVPLADASTASDVEGAVAEALQIAEATDQPLALTIAERLATRDLLLLLDNFEQVRPAVGQVAAWLAAAPQLTILVTSRERLRLPDEQVFAVPALTLPDRGDQPAHTRPPVTGGAATPEPVQLALAQSSALELFAARAQRVAYDFALTEANLPAAVELCHRLDGLPLAIELAAAHLDTMTPQFLLAALGDRLDLLDLLDGGPRDVAPRQQTLRATIGWSYELLEPPDRRLFAALGVFTGGCRHDAVAAVCPTDHLAERLATLVDKSLAATEADPDGEPRLLTLESIRAYAAEQLADDPGAAEIHDSHARHFAGLAEQAAAALVSPEQTAWMDLLSREHSNIRTALAWSLRNGDAITAGRTAASIWLFWGARGFAAEGRRWLTEVLDARQQLPPALLAKVLYGAGALARDQGDLSEARLLIEESLVSARAVDERGSIVRALRKLGQIRSVAGEYEQAQTYFRESLALARAEGEQDGIAYALSELGDIAIRLGRLDEARELVSESLELVRAARNTFALWVSLASLGEVLMFQGDLTGSRPLFEESLALGRDIGDVRAESWALHHLGKLADLEGRRDEAAQLFTDALALRHRIQERQTIADSLEALAGIAVDSDATLAARLLGAAEELRHRHRLRRPPVWQRYWDEHVDRLAGALDDAARHTEWTAGRTLPLDQVVGQALSLAPAGVPAKASPGTTG